MHKVISLGNSQETFVEILSVDAQISNARFDEVLLLALFVIELSESSHARSLVLSLFGISALDNFGILLEDVLLMLGDFILESRFAVEVVVFVLDVGRVLSFNSVEARLEVLVPLGSAPTVRLFESALGGVELERLVSIGDVRSADLNGVGGSGNDDSVGLEGFGSGLLAVDVSIVSSKDLEEVSVGQVDGDTSSS
jgi:hypothetical protein